MKHLFFFENRGYVNMKHVFNKLLFVYLVCIIPGQLTAMDEAGAALEPAHEHPVPEPNAPAEIELEPFIVNLREGGQHQISRDENETFSLSTFQELETAKSNENKEWIIARVVTRSNQAENGHFFDAHLLNHNLLTDGRFAYPFTNQNPGLALLTNPINREPANRPIEYYRFNPVTQQLNYFANSDNLFGPNAQNYHTIFTGNYGNDLAAAQVQLGDGADQDYERVRHYYE